MLNSKGSNMNKHSDAIWQREDARKIMREARKRFRNERRENPVAAHVALASDHYSLIKRHTNAWWRKPLALWHAWCAAWNANRADDIVGDPTTLTLDQIDVITTIWAKVPEWLDGKPLRARQLLEFALDHHRERESMKPHTRALMLTTLGDIKYRLGEVDAAWRFYHETESLMPVIETEDSEDRERQLVRVLTTVGFFYYDHAGGNLRLDGLTFVRRALILARRVSTDQEEKIRVECRKRGLRE